MTDSAPRPSAGVAAAGTGARRPRADRATLGSVAARAGVSRQTVSNVINAPHLVRSDTAARVQAAIDALSYRPHHAAQQLRTRRSHLLGLRIHQAPDPTVFDRFLHAVTEVAGLRDYRILLYAAPDDDREIDIYAELLDRWNVDGLILSSTHANDRRTKHLSELGVPYVTFGRPWDGPGSHSWVDVDGAAGTLDATRYLIAHGHSRIGFIGWPEGSEVGEDRLAGWARALAEADLPAPPPVRCANEITQGTSAATDLIRNANVTALVCVSDLIGIGALSAASVEGLIVGTDLAVIGFDDSDKARVAGLSSLSQQLPLVAEECVRLIVDQIAHGNAPVEPEHVLLPPILELRSSTQRQP